MGKVNTEKLSPEEFRDQLKFGIHIFAINATSTFRETHGRKMSMDDINNVVSDYKMELMKYNGHVEWNQTS